MASRRSLPLLLFTVVIGIVVWLLLDEPPATPVDPGPGRQPGAGTPATLAQGVTSVAPADTVRPSPDGERPLERHPAEQGPQEPQPDAAQCRLSLTILGPSDQQFPGLATITWPDGPKTTLPIEQRRFQLFSDRERGVPTHVRIEFAGFAEVSVAVPIRADAELDVRLIPAGSLTIELVDSRGFLLPERTVYCYASACEEAPPTYSYNTSEWGISDAQGRTTVEHLLPGRYRIVLEQLAEWSERIVDDVEVLAGPTTYVRLEVDVLPPESYGAFTLSMGQPPFDDDGPVGELGAYRFHTDDGRHLKLYRTTDGYRCAVPGEPGQRIAGTIGWRQGKLVHRPSYESDTIAVTVGGVVPAAPTWRRLDAN